ncbi:hypothetical protein NSQ90_12690 [Paenibacillus sp. FSL H7-0737]|uniref:hypothetical protein n=1 Tax=Paenibacillus sp. FSL H7-0737 TaxID=1536775 RepID=UPI000A526CDF|nr:hypothetical protein [Paenibacillus sp. FSL H7-0737]
MMLTLSVPSKPLEYKANSCASRLPECAGGTGGGPYTSHWSFSDIFDINNLYL